MSQWTDAVAALSPYLWWKLDETSGTTAADSSGNSLAGTYSSATLNQTGLIAGDSGGKSVTLATTAANVAKTSGMSYPNVGVSYAMTFKTSTDFTSGRIFQANSLSQYLSFGVSTMTATITISVAPSLAYDPSNLCDGNAHFIVYVVKTTSVELWVDGVMVASNTHAAAAATLTAFQLKQSSNNPTGQFDDALIFTSALSSTQIGDLYTAWSGATPAGSATLVGTLRAKTASFTAGIVGSSTLAGSLRAKTAVFTVGTVAAAALTGTLQPKTGAFAIATPAVDVTMPTQLQPKTGSFTAFTQATATLAGALRPKTANLSLDAEFDTTLSGTLQPKTAAFEVEAVGSVSPVVLVERVRVLVDDVDNPTNTVVNGADGFTLTEDPQPGDVVIVTAPQYDGYVTSVEGLGGTWTEVVGGYNPLWMSTDATTAGDITLTMDEGSAVLATAYLLRGLTETDVAHTELYQLDSGEFTGPEMLASAGQFVIATLHSGGRYALTYPSDTEPDTGWVPDESTSTTRFGEVYRIPTEVAPVPHRVDSYRLSLDARDMAMFVVGPLTPAETTLAGTLRRKTSAYNLHAIPNVVLAGTLQRKRAALNIYAVAVTAADRREGGRSRGGYATATWEPAVVPVPDPIAALQGERHIGSQAFSAVEMVGAQPVFTVSEASKKRLRHRILVGGKDVSFYRGIATPEPGYQLAEPLLWGTCSIEFPQIAAAYETPGELTAVSDLRWCAKGKPVVLQRVTADGVVVKTDYRGVVVSYDVNGGALTLQCGGHATGRAALRHKPLPIFRDTLDLGRLAWAAVRDLGLRFEPRLGPTTGIKQALFGGSDFLTYIGDLCAKAWQRDGTQWTVMPSEAGVYRMQEKDRDTVDLTIFNDNKRAVAQLRSDAAEEPNRIFASGVTPKGQRVRFGVYPGLKPGPAPAYPFEDGRSFGPGTEDADTDTGDGVFVMIRRLWTMGYLSLEEADGTYDQDVAKALAALQDDARATGPVGHMTEDLWAALFEIGATGFNIRGSRIEPAAQAPYTRRYRRSAGGAVLGKNPDFDPHALIVDRALEFGSGFTRHQMREWSRAEIARGEANWIGTIDLNTGGVLHGVVDAGTIIDGDDIMDVRAIKPGMNAYLPLFAGGIVVHIAAVEISYDAGGRPKAKLYVDTQARDALPVWEIIRRNRESKKDPARRWKGNRASSELKDSITEWDEVGGVLYGDVNLRPGWNVVPVVAGQEGSVSRLRLKVTGPDGEDDGREFACAVFGRAVTPKRLRTLIGNPLVASPAVTDEPDPDQVDPPAEDPEAGDSDPADVTSPAGPWWEKKAIKNALRDLDILYSAGTREDPCGYEDGKKAKGHPRTGVHRADAGFSYRTRREPVLYVAVWVWGERTLEGGRVMWNQLEAGA